MKKMENYYLGQKYIINKKNEGRDMLAILITAIIGYIVFLIIILFVLSNVFERNQIKRTITKNNLERFYVRYKQKRGKR